MRSPSLQPRQSGFTLLEVVVSVALFAIIAALAYGGLDSVLRARAQMAEQAGLLARLQFAVGQIERDLRAIADRPVRDAQGQSQPALFGTSTGFELSRHGYANALGAARAEIERAAYRRQQQRLLRLRWSALDRAPGSRPEESELLSGVSDFRLRYFGRNGREYDRWPAPGNTELRPRRVEVEIEVEGLGRIRRLLELPDIGVRR
jgi:general secretion pathway protein J